MEASDSDLENTEESDQGYEPSDVVLESASEEDDSDGEPLVESNEDSEEEKGKTWEELEREASNADREKGDESDSEDEKRGRKAKAFGKSRIPDRRNPKGVYHLRDQSLSEAAAFLTKLFLGGTCDAIELPKSSSQRASFVLFSVLFMCSTETFFLLLTMKFSIALEVTFDINLCLTYIFVIKCYVRNPCSGKVCLIGVASLY